MMSNGGESIILESERLILRCLTQEDAQEVFNNWANDQEVTRFMRWETHEDISVTKEWLRTCEETKKDPRHYEWGIVIKESNELIGSIGAFVNPKEPDRYELGYVLGKKYWGKGYATEALKYVIDFLVNKVGIRRFICSHAKENPASGAVMRHVGFIYKKEGTYQSFNGRRKFDSKIYYLDLS